VTAYYFGSSSGSKQKTEIIGKAFGWGGRGWRVGKEAVAMRRHHPSSRMVGIGHNAMRAERAVLSITGDRS
jgi:hypothetical protein